MSAKTARTPSRPAESEAAAAADQRQDSRVPYPATEMRRLPSGRRVVIHLADTREAVEIHSPAGEVEARVTLTPDGPVLSLRGARLEIGSLDDVSVRCRSFSVETSELTRLESRGRMALEAQSEMRLNGDQIYLNCPPSFLGDPPPDEETG